jgi:hypothetical protein
MQTQVEDKKGQRTNLENTTQKTKNLFYLRLAFALHYKPRSIKHYTESERSNNTKPANNRGELRCYEQIDSLEHLTWCYFTFLMCHGYFTSWLAIRQNRNSNSVVSVYLTLKIELALLKYFCRNLNVYCSPRKSRDRES